MSMVRLASLSRAITPRDVRIIGDVYDHRVMTTRQVARLHFGQAGERVAIRRLTRLHRYGLVDRFRPFAERGTRPYHWVLAPGGAALLAAHRDVEQLSYKHERALAVACSPHLGHMVGLVDCLVAFTRAARTTPGAQLLQWLNEAECARRWGYHVRPDAYIRWAQDEMTLHAFLEYDTGSEPLPKVAKKLRGYAGLAYAKRLPSTVLFAVHSSARERNLAEALAPHSTPSTPVYLTTHAQLERPGPAAAIWRPVGEGPRLTAVTLAARHPIG